ncbi:MAG: thymidylate synthase [Phenylobacterium sp. RIFCSPHIGHO2_01_FULL_69_31]|uniref:thymidylate synthase n=1 Tax=Phenylobacterium sp. RIFCSPHIGHO2_01_FULL_69_31 TaxID=1801944 RepID=UPI0008D4DAA4|nr:thymidylate synthase [Phenylobacterium sp. RIFCSPHIGHO2_01_FULL_69_31]OHB28809.1 MAG: thymidylate synthase [Phenylobacterium sp. RIFCSPHIGHO2_01_FULL_69_31]
MPIANDGSAERQYLELIEEILTNGVYRDDRTGVGTYSIHGATMRFDLSEGHIPVLTTKKTGYKLAIKEMLWFLSGETNIRPLLRSGVSIWSDWPHQKYVKATGEDIPMDVFEARILAEDNFAERWGDLGPVYGSQWRRWKGADGAEHDQLSALVEQIKTNPNSRRLLFHGWNVAEVDEMALPPCHLLYQYFVADGRLSSTVYQRSVDVGLGLPFNIIGASILLRMLAQQCDLEPGELFWVGHDVHIYANHAESLTIQRGRSPREFPKLHFRRRPESLFQYEIDDFEVTGYAPHPAISMAVAV